MGLTRMACDHLRFHYIMSRLLAYSRGLENNISVQGMRSVNYGYRFPRKNEVTGVVDNGYLGTCMK